MSRRIWPQISAFDLAYLVVLVSIAASGVVDIFQTTSVISGRPRQKMEHGWSSPPEPVFRAIVKREEPIRELYIPIGDAFFTRTWFCILLASITVTAIMILVAFVSASALRRANWPWFGFFTPRIGAAIALVVCISVVFGWAYCSNRNWEWQRETVRAGLRATGIAVGMIIVVSALESLNARRQVRQSETQRQRKGSI